MKIAMGPLTLVPGASLKVEQSDEAELLHHDLLPPVDESSESSEETPDSLSKEDQEAVFRLVNAIKKEHRRKRSLGSNPKNARKLKALDQYADQQTPSLETDVKGTQFNRAA